MGVTIERTGFSGMTMPEIMTGTAYMEEALAHTYIITPPEGVTYTGRVLAHVLRADDTAIAVNGTIDAQGRAVVTLIADCYHVAGRLQVAIYLTASDDSGVPSECIYACVTAIYRTVGSVELDSGSEIPTLAQLEAAYDACVTATADARAAADNAVIYSAAQTLDAAQQAQARENIGAASKTDVDVIARGHGENLIDLADLSAAGTNVAATVETDEQENRWLSVATTASQAWASVATPSGWVANNLTVGRTYRLHAKVEKVSGSLYLIVGFRGVQGNTGGYASGSSITFADNTVGGEGFVDFALTQYVQTISIVLTNGTKANVAIKVTDLWLTDVTDEAVIYSGHLSLTEGQQETARRNINTPLTPEASLIGRIATLYNDYASQNYRKVSVAGNHVSITKTSSSGSTFHGKSILGAPYSTETETSAISTTTARANRFREMYAAGAYAPLEGGIPFYNNNGTQYKLRMSYWTNGVGSFVQRHGLYLGTYNPDTDSVAEFGFYDVQSQTVDGSTVYILPALRELSITTDFLEAVNANKNLMALLIVRSGGDSGNVCHFVWDIVPDRSHYVQTVSGTTVIITAVENVRYECSTVTELSFTPSSSGLCEVVFGSGSTPTVLTLPETVRMPDWWTGVEANRTYDIMVLNGTLGMVTSWAT